MAKLSSVRCLVTGGAGYIGSHVVRALRAEGAPVVVVDNLSTGHRWATADAELVELDVGDAVGLEALLTARQFDVLLHFAAHIWVGESVAEPGRYYRNNTANAALLFDLAGRFGVRNVVFSSTAAVYGQPPTMPIDEDVQPSPINPYGASKAMSERILTDIAAARGQGTAILRYFNVAGAHDDGEIGEATPDNVHIVKVACETGLGLRPRMRVNGDDYPTPDGTCIRDYIHVQDLANAHVAALHRLLDGADRLVLNCGYGHGYSVSEVLEAFRRATGIDLDPEVGPRRPGDPAELIADNRRILATLDWKPERDDLDQIVESAWRWEKHWQAMRKQLGERR